MQVSSPVSHTGPIRPTHPQKPPVPQDPDDDFPCEDVEIKHRPSK